MKSFVFLFFVGVLLQPIVPQAPPGGVLSPGIGGLAPVGSGSLEGEKAATTGNCTSKSEEYEMTCASACGPSTCRFNGNQNLFFCKCDMEPKIGNGADDNTLGKCTTSPDEAKKMFNDKKAIDECSGKCRKVPTKDKSVRKTRYCMRKKPIEKLATKSFICVCSGPPPVASESKSGSVTLPLKDRNGKDFVVDSSDPNYQKSGGFKKLFWAIYRQIIKPVLDIFT